MGTIAEKLQNIANAKSAIASAITTKGGTVPTKFIDYGTAVSSLPNTYTAGDEGKVVSNGALVSQTSLTITENNTYDTTTKNSVTVNVGGSDDRIKAMATGQESPTWTVSASDLAGATRLRDYAFAYCYALTSITLPNTVTSFGNGAFWYCRGLTSITIPDGTQSLSTQTFAGCTGLTSITIPDSVTALYQQVFFGCSNLATIDFGTTRSTVPQLWDINCFNNLPSNYQILVPSALLDTWKATNNWNNSAVVDHIVAHT